MLYAVNPNFEQGTRLRSTPDADSRFNGYHVANDTEVEIVALHPAGFAEVIEYDAKGNIVAEGWLRRHILSQLRTHQMLQELIKADKIKSERDEARKEVDELKGRLQDATDELRWMRKQLGEAQQEADQLRRASGPAQPEHERSRILRLKRELEGVTSQLRNVEAELAALRARPPKSPTPGIRRLPSDQVRKASANRQRMLALMQAFHPDQWPTEMRDAVTPIFQQLSAAQGARSSGTS